MKWLDRQADRIAEKIGLIVSEKIVKDVEAVRFAQNEAMQRATALVKSVYGSLGAAAHALDVAAERMKNQGDAFGANQAKQAALAARKANTEHVQSLGN